MSLRAVERPGHRCTTRHAQAIYPFVATGGLGSRGVFLGALLYGVPSAYRTHGS